jgi:site-specific DNA-cytosine methylase
MRRRTGHQGRVRLVLGQVGAPQDRDRFFPPGMSRDEFLALLSAEVIVLVHRQAHQKPPDALLAALELIENKQLGKAIQIKSHNMPAPKAKGYVIISFLRLFAK